MAENPVTPQPEPLKVSALVIARKAYEAARRTVAALEQSTPREILEIVVADCGSQDGTATLDVDFPSVSMLRMPKNFGWTKAANIGTRTAKGEYLFLVPPGVEVAPGTVGKLAAYLDADTNAAAAVPLERSPDGAVVSTLYALPDADALGRRRSTGNWGPTAAIPSDITGVEFPAGAPVMVRRQAIVQINYFDEKRFGQFGADLDLFFQMKRSNRRVAFLPGVEVVTHQRVPELAHGYEGADLAHGAASYLGKWFGVGSGLGARIGGAFGRLGSGDLGGFARVLSGSKVDGTRGD